MNKTVHKTFYITLFYFSSFFFALITQHSIADNSAKVYSNLKPDEHVVVFRSAAHLSSDGQNWIIPINAWVFELEPRSAQKWSLKKLLATIYDIEITPEQEIYFDRSADYLFADSESRKTLVINIEDHIFSMPRTRLNGLTSALIKLPVEAVNDTDADSMVVNVVMPPSDDRVFQGTILKESFGSRVVISDFDDTVKITGAMNKKTLYESTFTKQYTAVEGMADLYRSWAEKHWLFHFVSSSPEQLYPILDEFLQREEFPPAVLHLKSFRFFDQTAGNLVRSATVTKPPAIKDIMTSCVECRFILIGDSGQEDPEVYTAIIKDYEDRVIAVGIRNVTDDNADHARYQDLIKTLGYEHFVLFDDPKEIQHFGTLQ